MAYLSLLHRFSAHFEHASDTRCIFLKNKHPLVTATVNSMLSEYAGLLSETTGFEYLSGPSIRSIIFCYYFLEFVINYSEKFALKGFVGVSSE